MERTDVRAVGRMRLALATGGGLGHAPVAPGTFGSLPGLALAWVLHAAGGWPASLLGAAVVTLAGFWAAEGGARHFGGKDPRPVVIDEVAGQMVALLFLTPSPAVLALGFLLFRAFDVVKPFPARRLEALPGGSGIMADDLAAGVYANLALRLLLWLVAM